MATQRQGLFSRSKGRDNVTAVRGSFESCKVDEALVGPYGGAVLPTGAKVSQEYWDNVNEVLYKFNGTVWVPACSPGGGGPGSTFDYIYGAGATTTALVPTVVGTPITVPAGLLSVDGNSIELEYVYRANTGGNVNRSFYPEMSGGFVDPIGGPGTGGGALLANFSSSMDSGSSDAITTRYTLVRKNATTMVVNAVVAAPGVPVDSFSYEMTGGSFAGGVTFTVYADTSGGEAELVFGRAVVYT